MKRNKLVLLPLLLLVCACTNGMIDTKKTSIKIDNNKDYLYVKDTYTIPFSKEQESYITKEGRSIYSYRINIDSESAKKTTDKLQQKAMTQIANIKKLDNGMISMSKSLTGRSIESSNYITILMESQPFIEGSEVQTNQIESYIFSKKNKKLITTEKMLKELQLTNEVITKKIKEVYAAQGKTICENAPGDCFYEPKIFKDDAYIADTVMYVDHEDNLVVYMQKSKGLSYEYVPVTVTLNNSK